MKPKGYSFFIHQVVHSNLGKAVVLDQRVNRPNFVNDDFRDALNYFYNQNSQASKNPSEWEKTWFKYDKNICNEEAI